MVFYEEQRGLYGFQQLLVVLEQTTRYCAEAIELLAAFDLDEQVSSAGEAAIEELRLAANQIAEAISTGWFDSALVAHGLDDGSPSMTYKVAILEAALNQLPAEDQPSEQSGGELGWFKRKLRRYRNVLRGGDIIIESALDVLPVGHVYSEIKQSTELGLEMASTENVDPGPNADIQDGGTGHGVADDPFAEAIRKQEQAKQEDATDIDGDFDNDELFDAADFDEAAAYLEQALSEQTDLVDNDEAE